MCVFVYVCGPDKLCWVMNLLPLPVSTNPPLWQTHTCMHTHLARLTAPRGVFRFGDPLYVNFVREARKFRTYPSNKSPPWLNEYTRKLRREKSSASGNPLNYRCSTKFLKVAWGIIMLQLKMQEWNISPLWSPATSIILESCLGLLIFELIWMDFNPF